MAQTSTSHHRWLRHHCYTTCPQRFPGIIRLHLIITDWSSAAGRLQPSGQLQRVPLILQRWPVAWEQFSFIMFWFRPWQQWGLYSRFWHEWSYPPPHIKRHNGSNMEAERACTGVLLNFRISRAYCSPHILAGSILSRLIGQTVKVRLRKKSEVAIQGRCFVSVWTVNRLPHSSREWWPRPVGYVHDPERSL